MQQTDLFPAGTLDPRPTMEIPGFRLEHDFVSPEEESKLLTEVDREVWQTDFRRRIHQYGLGYSSDRRRAPTWQRDFPEWLVPLAKRVAEAAPLERFPENSVVNEYIPPLGIGPHRDYDAFGSTVACVSLGSDIVMDFTQPDTGERVPVLVPRRSLWVVSGEARWKW